MTKYRAKRTVYDGFIYDSKLEARFAQILDIARAAENPANRVIWVARQVPFYFPWGTVHKLDFIVGKANGSVCFIEVKGYDTSLGKQKHRILEWFLGEEIEIWRG